MPASLECNKANLNLLLVDSEQQLLNTFRTSAESSNYTVAQARTSAEAESMLNESGFDAVLLNIECSGLDLCRRIRQLPDRNAFAVITFSDLYSDATRVEALAAGADAYIDRNSAFLDLLTCIDLHLEKKRLSNSSSRPGVSRNGSNTSLLPSLDLSRICVQLIEMVSRVTGNLPVALILKSSQKEPITYVSRGLARPGVNMENYRRWLKSNRSTSASVINEADEFLISSEGHKSERIVPLHWDSKFLGLLVVGVSDKEALDSTQLEATAGLLSFSLFSSLSYESARGSCDYLKAEIKKHLIEDERNRRLTEEIIDSLPVSLHAVDRDFRIVAWNRRRELGGQGIPRDAVLGRNIFDVLTKQPREILELEFSRAFETGQIERIEQVTATQNGETRNWLISKIPMRTDGQEVSHVITVGEDITERVKANLAVARAEKLAAIGRLATGVVHEINNPLATIATCSEILTSRLGESKLDLDEFREYLGVIHSEAFRCKTITRGLLDFSRIGVGTRSPIDVSHLLEYVSRLLAVQRTADKIEVKLEIGEHLPMVSGDQGQLQQAIVALAVNATDAMPEGGILTLSAYPKGGRVVIEVKDTGIGIPQENLTKIFDPFFTTKEVGHGTGLGLSVCYGIVAEHGGRISVSSAVGRGTTFTITLPALVLNGEK
jgi:two-component system, NtrC family, sensor kinase